MQHILRKKTAQHQQEKARRAGRLRDALVHRAQEKGHSPADLARVLDMSTGHWYRIKKEPLRLGRLSIDRVDAVAAYVGWPRVQVIIAIGWLEPLEVDQTLSAEAAIQDALRRLSLGSLSTGLVTPLERAAPDHKLLMGRLLLLAEGALAGASTSHPQCQGD